MLRLLPKGLALVNPEAVLLIDHDEAEVEEPDVVTQERMSADNDVRAAGDRAEQRLLSLGDRQLAGQQCRAKPRREVWTERRHDRAKVLRGENLGRCEQCRLSAALGDGKHGAKRDESLARSNLALHEAVHRKALGHVSADLESDVFLVASSSERQRRVEAVKHGALHPRRRRKRPCNRALLQQRRLQHEGLLKAQRFASRAPVGVFGRAMDQLDRFREREQFAGGSHRIRHRIVKGRQGVEHDRHRLLNLPRGHRRRCRVDRDGQLGPGLGG